MSKQPTHNSPTFRIGSLVLLAAAGAVFLCSCTTFRAGTVERKRGVFAPVRAAAYERAVAEGDRIQSEKKFLGNLVDVREDRLEELDENLRVGYGISLSRSYTYNPTNRTIFLVYPTEDGDKLLPHHAFPTQEEADGFLAVLAAKQALLRQLSVLREIYRETEREESDHAERMRFEFGIQPGQKYRYDPKTRVLWETVTIEPSRPRPSAPSAPKPAAATPFVPAAKEDPSAAAPAPKAEPKPAPKAEPKPAPKAEPKPAPKAEPKPAPKAEPKPAPKAVPARPADSETVRPAPNVSVFPKKNPDVNHHKSGDGN